MEYITKRNILPPLCVPRRLPLQRFLFRIPSRVWDAAIFVLCVFHVNVFYSAGCLTAVSIQFIVRYNLLVEVFQPRSRFDLWHCVVEPLRK
jgi:hypothetical protein